MGDTFDCASNDAMQPLVQKEPGSFPYLHKENSSCLDIEEEPCLTPQASELGLLDDSEVLVCRLRRADTRIMPTKSFSYKDISKPISKLKSKLGSGIELLSNAV